MNIIIWSYLSFETIRSFMVGGWWWKVTLDFSINCNPLGKIKLYIYLRIRNVYFCTNIKLKGSNQMVLSSSFNNLSWTKNLFIWTLTKKFTFEGTCEWMLKSLAGIYFIQMGFVNHWVLKNDTQRRLIWTSILR